MSLESSFRSRRETSIHEMNVNPRRGHNAYLRPRNLRVLVQSHRPAPAGVTFPLQVPATTNFDDYQNACPDLKRFISFPQKSPAIPPIPCGSTSLRLHLTNPLHPSQPLAFTIFTKQVIPFTIFTPKRFLRALRLAVVKDIHSLPKSRLFPRKYLISSHFFAAKHDLLSPAQFSAYYPSVLPIKKLVYIKTHSPVRAKFARMSGL